MALTTVQAGMGGVGTVTPGTSGNVLTSNGTTWVSQAPQSAIVSGTAISPTSSTSIDFTGIPSGVKRVTVMVNNMSFTGGASRQLLQIGTGGSPTTSGYTSNYTWISTNNSTVRSSNNLSANGWFNFADEDADVYTGTYVLTLLTGNTWICTGVGFVSGSNPGGNHISGSVTLSGALGMIRFTTNSGTLAYNQGTINIFYE
jgi:hypothetical protein